MLYVQVWLGLDGQWAMKGLRLTLSQLTGDVSIPTSSFQGLPLSTSDLCHFHCQPELIIQLQANFKGCWEKQGAHGIFSKHYYICYTTLARSLQVKIDQMANSDWNFFFLFKESEHDFTRGMSWSFNIKKRFCVGCRGNTMAIVITEDWCKVMK